VECDCERIPGRLVELHASGLLPIWVIHNYLPGNALIYEQTYRSLFNGIELLLGSVLLFAVLLTKGFGLSRHVRLNRTTPILGSFKFYQDRQP